MTEAEHKTRAVLASLPWCDDGELSPSVTYDQCVELARAAYELCRSLRKSEPMVERLRKLDGKIAVNRLEPIIPGDIDRLQERITELEERLATAERLKAEAFTANVRELNELVRRHDAYKSRMRSDRAVVDVAVKKTIERLEADLSNSDYELNKEKTRAAKFEAVLNKIAMYGMGADAYTKEFTNNVMSLVRDALGTHSRWPY